MLIDMVRAFYSAFLLLFLLWLSDPAGPASAQTGIGRPQSLPVSPLIIETASGQHVFDVELAATRRERAIGLMYRQEMDSDHGMLFDYPVPRTISMWMKNTYIPLDMLFIRANGKIANIAENTEPQSLDSIRSRGRVVAVLELNAGVVRQLGIAPGDQVRHRIFGNLENPPAE